ncbi:hypothetical protein KEM48_003767 [Puccinia striiformis f. sp. tritici PST-130]|nr:hypothetical protein KEM48_003767 [Puccinia striiformis f. sp. tritici PST-130]
MTGPPLYLTDTNYGPWAFLMKSKLGKIKVWQVVNGEKRLKEEDKPDDIMEYHRLDQTAANELVEHLDSNHLAYVSQTLSETEASSGYSIWRLLKHKYTGDDYISKDLALEKFLELQYIDSTANFIAEARAINHRLVSAKVGLDDQVKTSMLLRKLPSSFRSFRDVISVGCANDVVLCFGFKYQNVHILGYRIQLVEVISNSRAKQVAYREVQQSHQVGRCTDQIK